MGCVAYQQQSRKVPLRAETRLHREQRKLMPIGERCDMLRESRLNNCNGVSQRFQALRAYLLVSTSWKDITHLPVIESVENGKHSAHPKAAENAIRCNVLRQMWQFEPQNVHGRGSLIRHQACPLTHS